MIDNAVGKVKNELMYYLNDEYNWFWNIESDIVKDYHNHYFPESNSKKLEEKSKKRLKK